MPDLSADERLDRLERALADVIKFPELTRWLGRLPCPELRELVLEVAERRTAEKDALDAIAFEEHAAASKRIAERAGA